MILISRLAEHFSNMVEDAKVSLIAQEWVGSNLQAASRLTMICKAAPVPTEHLDWVQARYVRFFRAFKPSR